MSKRRRGFPSETQVKRGDRIVRGNKELREKLGRNAPCPCDSGRGLQTLLPASRQIRWVQPRSLLLGLSRSTSRQPDELSACPQFAGRRLPERIALKRAISWLALAALFALVTPAFSQSVSFPSTVIRYDVSLDKDGKVVDYEFVGELSEPLRQPAIAWLEAMQFEPAMIGDVAVASTTSVLAKFSVDSVADGIQLSLERYEVGPRLQTWIAPKYPRRMTRSQQGGWVEVSFTVTKDGSVSDVEVTRSSDRGFERSTVEAVRRWKFVPRSVAGEAIEETVTQVIEYRIPGA